MATSIVPHKALNDVDSMYEYLKQKISVANHITDPIPFINIFINIDSLKQQSI